MAHANLFSMFTHMNSFEESLVLMVQNLYFDKIGNWFFPFITDIHKQHWFIFSFVLPVLALWAYLEAKKARYYIFGFFLNLAITDAFCGQLVKKLVARPRPFQFSQAVTALSPASGFSFVSNHAANSFAMATFLSFYYPGYRKYFYGMAILISFSRVYNGVHFPSDVVVGALIGFVFARVIINYIVNPLLDKAKTVS